MKTFNEFQEEMIDEVLDEGSQKGEKTCNNVENKEWTIVRIVKN